MDDGQCSAVHSFAVTATDADSPCASVTISSTGKASGSAFVDGDAVSVTATDTAGNAATCSWTYNIVDNQPPTATLNSATTFLEGEAITYDITVSDNCPGATSVQTTGPAPGSTPAVGSYPTNFELMDAAGSTVDFPFTITVDCNDAVSTPVLSGCPGPVVTLNMDDGQCSAVHSFAVTATDADSPCASVTISSTGKASGSAFVDGDAVSVTATDTAGNAATCSWTYNIVDNQPPTATLNSPSTFLEGEAITYDMIVSDNCPGTTSVQTAGPAAGSTPTAGSYPTNFELQDAAGTTVDFPFTIIIGCNDASSAPVLSGCKGPIVTLNTDPGLCSAVDNFSVTFSDADACAVVTMTSSGKTSGSAFVDGDVVSYTASDSSGNTVTCSWTYDIVDNEPPTATLNSPNTFLAGQPISFDVTVVDNCGGTSVQTAGPAPGSTPPLGEYPSSFQLQDSTGNLVSFPVVIEVVTGFTITQPDGPEGNVYMYLPVEINFEPAFIDWWTDTHVRFEMGPPGAPLYVSEELPIAATTVFRGLSGVRPGDFEFWVVGPSGAAMQAPNVRLCASPYSNFPAGCAVSTL